MIVTMVPYCPAEHGTNLGYAYNEQMKRLHDGDWACFIDHDACFTTTDWYRQLEAITAKLADPCVLTARTNRVGSPWQRVEGVSPDEHSMAYHRRLGARLRDECGTDLQDVTDFSLMSGVVILLSRRTWEALGGFADGFLGVDNQIHQAARDRRFKVYLMRGVYVYHWYRADQDGPPDRASDLWGLVPAQAGRVLSVHHADGSPDSAGGVAAPPGAAVSEVILRRTRAAELNEVRGEFDCIVCHESLSYLRDPAAALRLLRERLAAGGRLVASFANARHRFTVAALLEGEWRSPGGGSREPLRVFTRREIEKLLFRSGFSLREMRPVAAVGSQGEMDWSGLYPEQGEEFSAERFLVAATLAPRTDHRLTSIVIVTHNQLHYTRQCVESIRARTDPPYELVFVDNGSTDGTAYYLRSLPGATVIENPENRGFPVAANQGIGASRGEQVLLLNNDTLVTTGWLDRLLAALESDPSIGLVGPCSNHVSGPQEITPGYDDLASLDGFAWEWGKRHAGRAEETGRLVGFCLLLGRRVIDKVGLLDERFGLGNFEDDDYCLRAAGAGFKAVIARDAFVHHFGSASFRGAGVDLAALLQSNEQLFREKWQAGVASAPPDPPPPGSGRPRLSLCMIVRDSGKTLPACLRSIQPWVDEMVVVDTGSRDNTPAIAEGFGAKVFHFPWCDDFSAARNESVRHATGEWVFWMDSDDTIDADNGRRLRELAYADHDPAILGYVMQVHCPGPGSVGAGGSGGGAGDKSDVTAVDHVKLFRNRPDLRFDHRIHEQIIPAIRAAGGEVGWTDLFVTHSGSDQTPEGRARKQERDLRLLQLELNERPGHPFTFFNLGMTHADMEDHRKAVTYLRQSLAAAAPAESHVRKIYALLVGSLAQLREHEEARELCRQGLAQFPDDPELLFRRGLLCHHFGDLEGAERAYLAVLEAGGRAERHFSSIDRGIGGFKARHNLAVVYTDAGRLDLAEEQWRRVVADMPQYRSGWRGLVQCLLSAGKVEEAEREVDRTGSDAELRAEALTLAADVATARGDLAGAEQFLRRAAAEYPQDTDAVGAWCQFLFENGPPDEAEVALTRLAALTPNDPSVHHNLAALYLGTGRPVAAAEACRRSLALRPDCSRTVRLLEQANS